MSETTNLKLYKHDEPLESNTNSFNVDKALNSNWDKIDNAYKEIKDNINNLDNRIEALEDDNASNKMDITTLQNKVTTLEEDNTTNKNNIETLQQDNTTNKSNIETLQEGQEKQDTEIGILINALPSETQEGENINIKGTLPVKFKEFSVKGNSKQDTREGYNLLNYNSIESTTINGVTFVINDDKSITVNGTATANATLNLVRRTWKLSS